MENLADWLPVERLYETPLLLAFSHPRPTYATHILIIPKKAVRNLLSLEDEDDEFARQFMADLITCVRLLVIERGLEKTGYRLIVNGGEYQDIPQLHFHLVSGMAQA